MVVVGLAFVAAAISALVVAPLQVQAITGGEIVLAFQAADLVVKTAIQHADLMDKAMRMGLRTVRGVYDITIGKGTIERVVRGAKDTEAFAEGLTALGIESKELTSGLQLIQTLAPVAWDVLKENGTADKIEAAHEELINWGIRLRTFLQEQQAAHRARVQLRNTAADNAYVDIEMRRIAKKDELKAMLARGEISKLEYRARSLLIG